MQQTESSKLTLEDKKELEVQIRELTQKITESDTKRQQLIKYYFPEAADEYIKLCKDQVVMMKELRRLRRMRS